jgi:transcriptional regulator with XRE-family HTH domain
MLTAQQCRMARAALNIGVRELAAAADLSPNTIARLERGETLHRRTLAHVQGALEAQGVAFLTSEVGGAWPGPVVAYAPGRRLTGRARLFSNLWSLPNFHRDAPTVFNSLLDILESYLDIIRHENREPDPWEREQLNYAVNALNKSDVFSAYSGIICGIAPPDNQSRDYRHPDDDADTYKDLTMAYFRRAVGYLRSSGYTERYPATVTSERVTGHVNPAIISPMDDIPTPPVAPEGWLEALAASDADLAAGRIVPGEVVLRDLKDSLARLEAKAADPVARRAARRR